VQVWISLRCRGQKGSGSPGLEDYDFLEEERLVKQGEVCGNLE